MPVFSKTVFSKRRAIVAAVLGGTLLLGSLAAVTAGAAFSSKADTSPAPVDEAWHAVELDGTTQGKWDDRAMQDLANGQGGRFAELNIHRNSEAPAQVRVRDDNSYVAVVVYVESNIVAGADNSVPLPGGSSGTAVPAANPFTRYSTVTALYKLPLDTAFSDVDPQSVTEAGDYAMLITDAVTAQDGSTDTDVTRFDYVDGVLANWDSVPHDGPWVDSDECGVVPDIATLAALRALAECDLAKEQADAGSDVDSDNLQLDRTVSCMSSVMAYGLWNQVDAQSCSIPDPGATS